MEITDYIFIGCFVLDIFSLLVVLLKKIIKIPEEMMIKSILWLCTNILLLKLKAPKHLKNNNIFKLF